MISLTLVLILTLASLLAAVFLLGFRLGGEHWQAELTHVRLEAARAERQLHDLTRQAFIAMAEERDRRRPDLSAGTEGQPRHEGPPGGDEAAGRA